MNQKQVLHVLAMARKINTLAAMIELRSSVLIRSDTELKMLPVDVPAAMFAEIPGRVADILSVLNDMYGDLGSSIPLPNITEFQEATKPVVKH